MLTSRSDSDRPIDLQRVKNDNINIFSESLSIFFWGGVWGGGESCVEALRPHVSSNPKGTIYLNFRATCKTTACVCVCVCVCESVNVNVQWHCKCKCIHSVTVIILFLEISVV